MPFRTSGVSSLGRKPESAASGAARAAGRRGRVADSSAGPTSFPGGETAGACGEAGGPHVVDPGNLQPADVFGRQFGERREAPAAGVVTISGPFLCCRDWRTGLESFETLGPIVPRRRFRGARSVGRARISGRLRQRRKRDRRSRGRRRRIRVPAPEILRQVVQNRREFGVAAFRAKIDHLGDSFLPARLPLPQRNGLLEQVALAADACGFGLTGTIRQSGRGCANRHAQPRGREIRRSQRYAPPQTPQVPARHRAAFRNACPAQSHEAN